LRHPGERASENLANSENARDYESGSTSVVIHDYYSLSSLHNQFGAHHVRPAGERECSSLFRSEGDPDAKENLAVFLNKSSLVISIGEH